MRKAVAALVLLSACKQDHCADPGAICTYMGTGLAALSSPGMCREDAVLYWPSDLTIGPDGQPYVLDWNNHRIITVVPGSGGDCDTVQPVTGNAIVGDGPAGPAMDASWNHPTNIAFLPNDDTKFVFAAWHDSRVVEVDLAADTVAYVAGTGSRDFFGDGGPALSAKFDLPSSVQWGDDDTLYISDQANQRVRHVKADGNIETVVGDGTPGFLGDGGPALQAELQNEISQSADPAGRIAIDGTTMYIADTSNERVRVVDMTTWTIDTFAGSGEQGYGGDGGDALAAKLNAPRDVEVASNGDVYIADTGNSCVRVVHAADHTIDTVAGTCGKKDFAGDNGPAVDSELNLPLGIELGPDGTLYIADSFNQRIRVVTPG